MKNIMKRVMVTMLALMLVGGMLLPAALASENRIVANSSRITTYVGMRTQLVVTDKYGNQKSVTDYRWKSSRKTVATVNSSGVVTARKTGSTTITATNKYNSRDKLQVVIKVNRNKHTNSISKPSPSSANYKSWTLYLKSIEIVSPSKVCVEYYMVVNYPSNWRVTKLNSLRDYIRAINRNTDAYVTTVIDGYGSTVSGLRSRSGRFVQTIKITFPGSAIYDTDLRLANYRYNYYPQGELTYRAR